jgi:hypothetical protein
MDMVSDALKHFMRCCGFSISASFLSSWGTFWVFSSYAAVKNIRLELLPIFIVIDKEIVICIYVR